MNETTSTTIYIQDDAFTDAILNFVRESALRFCTRGAGAAGDEVDTRGDDTIAITAQRDPDTFSTGEAAQWRILQSLTTGDLRTVLDRCDPSNVRALVNVINGCSAVPA